MAEKYECRNCGNDLSLNDEVCAYCGSENPYYVKPKKKGQPADNVTPETDREKKKKELENLRIFGIVFLFIFPIFGIIIIIVTSIELSKYKDDPKQ